MILSSPGDLSYIPRRIVSLVPSQTELLYSLGLDTEVIGITKFCVHPGKWFRSKTRIGGTKTINSDKIAALHSDLVIANREENVKEQVEFLACTLPVWVTEVSDLAGSIRMIHDIGLLTNRAKEAETLTKEISAAFDRLGDIVRERLQVRVAYLIWKDPYMSVGGDSFISDMLAHCGFINVFKELARYPEISLQQIREMHCDCVLISSEPYPFSAKHSIELEMQLPGTKVMLVDGEMFSWYGSRLLKSASYFEKLVVSILSQNLG